MTENSFLNLKKKEESGEKIVPKLAPSRKQRGAQLDQIRQVKAERQKAAGPFVAFLYTYVKDQAAG